MITQPLNSDGDDVTTSNLLINNWFYPPAAIYYKHKYTFYSNSDVLLLMINATKKPFVRYYATTGYEPKSDSGINNATETTTTTSVSAHTPRITTVQYPHNSGTGKPFLNIHFFLYLAIPSTRSDTTSSVALEVTKNLC